MRDDWDSKHVGARLYQRCEQLAQFSESEHALTRVYLSPQHQLANQQVVVWMKQAGMTVWQDAVGNMCGRYEGITAGLPALLIGSHLDTVRNAGKYDGMLGVVTAIELVERLSVQAIRLPFAIEVVAFADEEGTRFGSTLLGSRGLTGQWQDDWLGMTDAHGISIAQAMREFGLDPELISQARRGPEEFIGYLEVHIEQGPQLEKADLPVGVVTAINGAKRVRILISGEAGHAGTVPMSLRHDALVAASEMVLAIEQVATEQQVVATVGQIQCEPGAVNVIPAQVSLSLDVRSEDDGRRDLALDMMMQEIGKIALARQISVEHQCFYDSSATPCDPLLQALLSQACQKVQGQSLSLASGAGHDAMAIAELCPVGMLFVRCKDGVSHHPAESVIADDLGQAFGILWQAVKTLAG